MRFLVDECTGPAVAQWLRAQKHEVFSVYEEARGMEINRPICGCNRKAGSFCSHVVMGACPIRINPTLPFAPVDLFFPDRRRVLLLLRSLWLIGSPGR
jgi:hypothetical protein